MIWMILFLSLNFSLEAVDFVLFTQPKTATHLLIPILTELSGKQLYWAKDLTQNAGEMQENILTYLHDPNLYIFNLDREPWSRETWELVWATNARRGCYLHLHAPYSEAMENFLHEKKSITFFVKRDPRDQIVSLLNHYKYINYNDKEAELLATDDEKLTHMIQKEMKRQTLHYMSWIDSPLCCVLDFEKLMGAHGGAATDSEAIQELRKIATWLELDVTDAYLEKVYRKHFGHGWNYFKGKVGVWRDYLTNEHKALIKAEIGAELIAYGYEQDYSW
jgi:hypothetical protein